jgi:excisionase family DNA binding protein
MSLRRNPTRSTLKPDVEHARLVRVRFAARYLGISRKLVHNLILEGELPYVKLRPGENSPFLLDMRDLDRFIESAKSSRDT